MTQSWATFAHDKKILYIVEAMKELLKERKDVTISTPFTNEETNTTLKMLYLRDEYASSSAFWNGGTHNMIKKALKGCINSILNPKFTNKLLEDLGKKIMFHGFGEDPSPSKKRKHEDLEETKIVEDKVKQVTDIQEIHKVEYELFKKACIRYETFCSILENKVNAI